MRNEQARPFESPARSRRANSTRTDPDAPSGAVGTPLTTLMPLDHAKRLMIESALSGTSPDELVGQALAEYFARLDLQRGDGAS